MILFMRKKLVENAEHIGQSGELLVLRSDFTMLILTVAVGIICCDFIVCQALY